MRLVVVFRRIRPKAVCLIWKGDKLHVQLIYWPVKPNQFYIPLGGSIKYGEYGRDAIAREVLEEIGAELKNIRYLGTLENIFTVQGEIGHEIVLVFDAEFTDARFYEMNPIRGVELELTPPSKIEAYWRTLQEIEEEGLPLYPERLGEFLNKDV